LGRSCRWFAGDSATDSRRCNGALATANVFFKRVTILSGVLAMRWNVVIGGQMFSKSLRGLMSYKMEFSGLEGWFMG
jgi:hypothetical protein